jgi:hypothetical protein
MAFGILIFTNEDPTRGRIGLLLYYVGYDNDNFERVLIICRNHNIFVLRRNVLFAESEFVRRKLKYSFDAF